jgi:hypothetical protein
VEPLNPERGGFAFRRPHQQRADAVATKLWHNV